eukprot:6206064-Pleurochrysis_carterae.AAC.3
MLPSVVERRPCASPRTFHPLELGHAGRKAAIQPERLRKPLMQAETSEANRLQYKSEEKYPDSLIVNLMPSQFSDTRLQFGVPCGVLKCGLRTYGTWHCEKLNLMMRFLATRMHEFVLLISNVVMRETRRHFLASSEMSRPSRDQSVAGKS